MCLALGCADKVEPIHGDMTIDAGGSGGSASGGQGGTGGAGTGGAGQTCSIDVPFPEVYACVDGDGVNGAIDALPEAELSGVVAILGPEAPPCQGGSSTRHLGNSATSQRYAVVNDVASIELTLGIPVANPILTPGQTVSVSYKAKYDFWLPSAGTLIVRDDAGKVLYWLTQSANGRAGLDVPDDLTIEIEEPSCTSATTCGSSTWGGALVVRSDDGEIAIELGEQADVGDYNVIFVSNSSLFNVDTSTCPDRLAYQKVAVAFLPRGLTSQCFGMSESACSSTDGCRDVQAYFGGETSPTFVACVDDSSCSDGDLVTCAFNLLTDQVAAFTTTCVPPGWTRYEDDVDCSRGDDDAGID